ncbi:MAG: T9SS type A sorting domain-containing protein [Fluviicola sp.]|nr:T9SS type A sorting domain-containing protein [Fluviicola sp.]
MIKHLLSSFIIFTSIAAHSQYCMTAGPSSGIDSNLESLTLVGSTGSISYTGCSGTTGIIGLEEQLGSTVYIDAGNNYNLNLQFGTCGGNYSGVGEAWIDFNLDGIFSPSESIGTWTGIPPTAASIFNFLVPGGAQTGQSRLRVIQREASSLPIDPCASFTWGSATDFSVYIQNGVDCSAYIGDDTTSPRLVTSLPYSENYNNSLCYSNQNPVYSSPDVYYLITGLNSVPSIEVSLCGSAFDTFLSIMKTNGDIIAINDDHVDCGSQSKIAISTGNNDSLYVIVEGWNTNSGAYTISINEVSLSINELTIYNPTIYPNPTKDFFTLGENFNGEINIYNSESKLLLNQNVTAGELIDVTKFNSGFYYITLGSKQGIITKKLIIH